MKRTVLVAAVLAISAATGWAKLPQPPDYAREQPSRNFGNQRNVDLLAAMLADADSTVRERVLANLGDTHNDRAVPLIAASAKDPEPSVRVAVMNACTNFDAAQVRPIVAKGLADDDRAVVLAALRTVRALGDAQQGWKVLPLLSHADPSVQASALATLNMLGVAAPAEASGRTDLRTLLASPRNEVKLRALENALLLAKADTLAETLRKLAATGPSAVRAAAIAALGKFDYAHSGAAIAAYASDPDPMVRAGAVKAYVLAGQGDKILPFVQARQANGLQANEPSELVRLEAIRAAGTLKVAGAAKSLFVLCFEAPASDKDRQDARLDRFDSHLAARDALIAIGGQDVCDQAASRLKVLIAEHRDFRAQIEALLRSLKDIEAGGAARNSPQHKETSAQLAKAVAAADRAARNLQACCHILGALKSTAALDTQIALLKEVPADSPVLAELAWSLGAIGDAKAVAPLLEKLDVCVTKAQFLLATRTLIPPPYVEYDEAATAQIVTALTRLKAQEAFENIHKLATMRHGMFRLEEPSMSAALRSYDFYMNDSRREAIESATAAIIADRQQRALVRYVAMKQAGKLRMTKAQQALTGILRNERPDKPSIAAAAWALQELTGKTPELTQPVVRQGDWVIKATPQ